MKIQRDTHILYCHSDEILSEANTEEGPLVILRGGEVYKKVVLYHLLTGEQEPMLVPYNAPQREQPSSPVRLTLEQLKVPFTKEPLRAYSATWSESYDALRHGEDWMLSWGEGSTCQMYINNSGKVEGWITPAVRPLVYDGNLWTTTWFGGGRGLVLLCDPAVARILIRDPVPGYYPSLAACTDPSVCEKEIEEFKRQASASVKQYTELVGRFEKLLQENIGLQEKLTLSMGDVKNLEKQVHRLQHCKYEEERTAEVIRRLEADLAVARSQIKGVDQSRI
jgi:hypothetical protein